ncbi:tetratricopeptide repeat protein [bacterium]|nr:tetratricopeptide repeat protein [bacterium]
MDDENPLRPSRAVAIFPFGVSASPVEGRQADLCRGLAVLVERRLGRLPGVQPLLQNLFVSPESDPGKKGWLLTNSLWSVEQALALPIVNGENPSHLIQGLLTFEDDSLRLEMELIDLEGGYSLARESHEAPATELSETFFRVLRPIAASLMESAAAGRVVTRLPTRDADAFELLVLGLASAQAHALGMVGSVIPLHLLTEAVEKDGELIEGLQELERLIAGLNLEDEENRATAIECLGRARAAAPWNTGLLAVEGLIHARQGRATDAVPLLEKFLEHDKRSELASQAMAALARIQRDRNDLAAARRLLHAAIAASPENASAWEDLAACHLAAGEIAQAEECWRRALQEDPDRPVALLSLGEAHIKRGDAERATPLLQRALGLGMDRARVVPPLAESHLAAGRLEEADDLVTELVEENPEALSGWMLLARVRQRRQDTAAVARCLRESRRLAASARERADAELLDFSLRQPFEHAEYRRLLMMPTPGAKEAESFAWKLTNGVFGREQHPDILLLAARFAERAGQPANAARWIQAATTRLGGNRAADQVRIARLYIDAGERDEALAALAHLDKLDPQNAETAGLRRRLDAVPAPEQEVESPVPIAPIDEKQPTLDKAERPGFLSRIAHLVRRLFP